MGRGEPPPNDTAAAELLAATPYRVIRPLGGGGMGDVFEAEHVGMAKRVVVKVMRAEFARRPDVVDRMRVEGQALARVAHPNVVPVLDLGWTADQRPFVVMDLLVGRTLEDELRARGSLPFREAIDRVLDALAGLGAAHQLGIVHRDVKLANLFVVDGPDARPLVRVLDFGLAKIVAGGHRAALAPAPLAFPTVEGMMVGTPRYVSPEQALGQPVDARTDLYAVGVVLYCLIAGRGPFDHHKTSAAVIKAQLSEIPLPPSRHTAEAIPAALDAIVQRTLAKRREDRFGSAAELASELIRVAQVPGPMAEPRRDELTRPARAEAPTRAERLAPVLPAVTVAAASATALLTAAPPPDVLAARARSVALTCLILGSLDLAWRAVGVVRVALVLADPSSALPAGSSVALSAKARATGEALATRVAFAESGRVAVMAAASAALIVVALRLRRGDARALGWLRAWTLAAFACLGIWVALDLAVVLPATLEFGDLARVAMRASGSETSTLSVAGQLSKVYVYGVIVLLPLGLAVLPVALRIWTGRMLRTP